MNCKNCGSNKQKFRCERCLKIHLLEHRKQVDNISKTKAEYVVKAKTALEKMSPSRKRRASKAVLEATLSNIDVELERIRERNEQLKSKLSHDRIEQSNRRQLLDQVKFSTSTPNSSPSSERLRTLQPSRATLEALHRASLDMSAAIARARYGLVRELVEVFDIVEVGGRPSLAGRPGIRGEWNIVGGVLPVPGDIRRYPPEQINATVQHTLHFLSILTYYLGIKLPFQVHWTGSLPSIGQPSITAGKGSEHGGWAKWTDDYNLYLDPLPSPSGAGLTSQQTTSINNSAQPPPEISRSKKRSTLNTTAQVTTLTSQSNPSNPTQSHLATLTSFTTGLTMLLYNVAYLAHTQGVDIELSQSGEVLRNLWAVCCSPELGKRSHVSKTPFLTLPPPTPPTFPIEFNQLLQAITAKPPPGTGLPIRGHGSSIPGAAGMAGLKTHGGRKGKEVLAVKGGEDTILEEEEWDMV